MLVPQLFVSLKSPEAETDVNVRAAVPVFESVTVCAGLAMPVFSVGNPRLVGETLAAGLEDDPPEPELPPLPPVLPLPPVPLVVVVVLVAAPPPQPAIAITTKDARVSIVLFGRFSIKRTTNHVPDLEVI